MSDIRVETSHRIVDETESVEPITFGRSSVNYDIWEIAQEEDLVNMTATAAIALANSILELTKE